MLSKSRILLVVLIPLTFLISMVVVTQGQSRESSVSGAVKDASKPASRSMSLGGYLKNLPKDVQKSCKKITVHYDMPSDIAKRVDDKEQSKILKAMINDGAFGRIPPTNPELPGDTVLEDNCTPTICCMQMDDEPEECWPCCAD